MSRVFNTTGRVLVTSTGGVIDPYGHADVDTDDPSVVDALVAGYIVHADDETEEGDTDDDETSTTPAIDVPPPAPKAPKAPKLTPAADQE